MSKVDQIVRFADGVRSSTEIADLVGASPRYVRRVVAQLDLPRLPRGAQPGERNHQWISGRRIDLDGYVLVTAPDDHPTARERPDRRGKVMLEHRLVMERTLERPLGRREVVDHIDGLTLHNDPSNLRLFETNAAHLAATVRGRPTWSARGLTNIGTRSDLGRAYQPVDTYRLNRARGDVRLRAILRAALQLGIGSPFLLGSSPHLERAGIDPSFRSSLRRALDELESRWLEDHPQ